MLHCKYSWESICALAVNNVAAWLPFSAMAVFFDHKVKSPVQGQFTDIQWHKTAPLLAVACLAEPAGNGVVNLFMEEVSVHFYPL